MERKFKFDPRIVVPEAPAGKEYVKCFGVPLLVCSAEPGEARLASGLTRSQQDEVVRFIGNSDIRTLRALKRGAANGRVNGASLFAS